MAESQAGAHDRIDRFVILARLGEGGMGVVYAAWDPKLDRRVAVKRVHPGRARDDAQDRLLREARAMARVSHPNVVQVFDVGVDEGAVWIAMEYVDGRTLNEWLKTERRAWRDVVAMLRGAGEGLAAAHAAGLIHRDFKPDNVLIGGDGRARVADFGLVRPVVSDSSSEDPPGFGSMSEGSQGSLDGSDALTRDGVILGTLHYMAPEQFLHHTLDARADQFSFCVVLYKALYRQQPFPGKRLSEISSTVVGGLVRQPRDTEVPTSVTRVVLRGLARKPDDRFADMHALLRELDLATKPRRRAWRAALVVGPLVVAGLIALVGDRDRGTEVIDPCASGQATIAEVWADRRTTIAEHFTGLDVGYAERSFAVVDETLTNWTTTWSEAYGETCVARHEQSAELYDLRMACLARQRDQVAAFVELLAEADAELVSAVPERMTLPDVEVCADIESLRAVEKPSRDQAESVRAARAELAPLLARLEAEQYDVGPALSDLRTRAEAIGHRPLIAEVAQAQGDLARSRGQTKEAREDLLIAHELALATRHDSLALETASALILADDPGEYEQGLALGRRWHVIARGLAERAGNPPAAELERRLAFGRLLAIYARHDEAMVELERAAELAVELHGPDHLRTAVVEQQIALVFGDAGLHSEAERRLDRVIRIYEQRLGPDHPILFEPLWSRATLARTTGRLDQALRDAERMKAIQEAAFGPDNRGTLLALQEIAIIHDLRGEPQLARELFEAILVRTNQRERVENRLGTNASNSLCFTLLKLGELDEARRTCERALDGAERTYGIGHWWVAIVLNNLGSIARAEGQPEQGLELDRRALAICEASMGPDHITCASPQLGIAESSMALGRVSEALAPAERALAIRRVFGDPGELGEAECLLARALPKSEHERARELASAGLNRLRAAGPNWKLQADACASWLSEH